MYAYDVTLFQDLHKIVIDYINVSAWLWNMSVRACGQYHVYCVCGVPVTWHQHSEIIGRDIGL